MKRTIFALATLLVVILTVFAVLALRPVRKVKAHNGCSDATLQGSYGVVGSGFFTITAELTYMPANFSLLANFNGKGGLSGSSLNFIEGGNTSGDVASSFVGGTYTINSNCTCTLITPPIAGDILYLYGIVVDTGGDEVVGSWYDNTDSDSGSFQMKKVSDSDEP